MGVGPPELGQTLRMSIDLDESPKGCSPMLPLDCHYVAEIRYQEHVRAARPSRHDEARSAPWLSRLGFGWVALVALGHGLINLAGRSVRLPARLSSDGGVHSH